jgi:hypothetical protein
MLKYCTCKNALLPPSGPEHVSKEAHTITVLGNYKIIMAMGQIEVRMMIMQSLKSTGYRI